MTYLIWLVKIAFGQVKFVGNLPNGQVDILVNVDPWFLKVYFMWDGKFLNATRFLLRDILQWIRFKMSNAITLPKCTGEITQPWPEEDSGSFISV